MKTFMVRSSASILLCQIPQTVALAQFSPTIIAKKPDELRLPRIIFSTFQRKMATALQRSINQVELDDMWLQIYHENQAKHYILTYIPPKPRHTVVEAMLLHESKNRSLDFKRTTRIK
ncbi:MAG: hypothetical protein ACOH5I_06605 [Oligoflexus sp.]